jgi:hypothetical protein
MAFLSDAKILRSPFPEKDKNRVVCHISVLLGVALQAEKLAAARSRSEDFLKTMKIFPLIVPVTEG